MINKILLNKLELLHSPKFHLLNSLLTTYIEDQLTEITSSLKIFLEHSPENTLSSKKKLSLIRGHKKALSSLLSSECPYLPKFLIIYVLERLQDEAKGVIEEVLGIGVKQGDIEDFEDTWSSFLKNRPLEFWDKDINQLGIEDIIKFFKLFLICQDTRNQQEVERVNQCYHGLTNWFASCYEEQGEDITSIFEFSHKSFEPDIRTSCSSSDYQQRLLESREELLKSTNVFQRQYLMFHVAVYLLGGIEDMNEVLEKIPQGCLVHFLWKFMECFYTRKEAKVLLLLLKRKLFKTFHGSTSELFPSNCYKPFLIPSSPHTVDYIAFTSHMIEHPGLLQEYSQQCAEEGEKRGTNSDKAFYRRVIKDSSRIIKENEDMKAQFECLTLKKSYGKHAVIAVSGFLSEQDDNSKAWEGLLSEYHESSRVPVYSFKWKASSYMDFPKSMVKSGSQNLTSMLISGAKKSIGFAHQAYDMISQARGVFTNSIDCAKASGRLLAHALMSQFPFADSSISFIGFSLGTQVIYSCLEELEMHSCDYLISNVYLLGGAVSVENIQEWRTTLSIVNGVTYNCYCESDYILQIYRATVFKYPIGLGPILENKTGNDTGAEEEAKVQEILTEGTDSIRVENHDVTSQARGHLYYRENLDLICEAIDFIG